MHIYCKCFHKYIHLPIMNKHSSITITDIAKELNVSVATVSRAINNHPYVKPELKERIIKLAEQYGYHPSSLASGLRKGKTKTIGIVIPRNNRNFFSTIISSVEEVLTAAGYNTLICQSFESLNKETSNIKTLIKSNVSGIIISHCLSRSDYKHIEEAINKGIKVVQFDRVFNHPKTSTVVNDNQQGAKDVVLHMLKQGYRKIAFFYGSYSTNIFKERQQGFLDAHKELGLEPDPDLFFKNTLTRDEGYHMAKNMIKKNINFDAIFSCGDYSALGAYLYIKEKGLRIPEDIGIAGFADEPFTELTSPSITSVNQNDKEMGRLAAEQLIREIENNKSTQIKITIPTIARFRESTQRIKKQA